jgi:hypothetical protein
MFKNTFMHSIKLQGFIRIKYIKKIKEREIITCYPLIIIKPNRWIEPFITQTKILGYNIPDNVNKYLENKKDVKIDNRDNIDFLKFYGKEPNDGWHDMTYFVDEKDKYRVEEYLDSIKYQTKVIKYEFMFWEYRKHRSVIYDKYNNMFKVFDRD